MSVLASCSRTCTAPYLQSNYDNGDKPVIVCVACMWAALTDATKSVYANVYVCVFASVACLPI